MKGMKATARITNTISVRLILLTTGSTKLFTPKK